jgi:hypothetical protein
MPARCTTRPDGVTITLKPVGAACTVHRPVSIARIRVAATCWFWISEPWKLAPLVGLSNT